MSAVECLAWAGGTWMAIAIAAAWIKHRAQQRNREARVQQQRAQRLEDIETRAAVPAAPDNTEGVNRGDWDDCELILNATNEAEAGWQRLINDLRKEDT